MFNRALIESPSIFINAKREAALIARMDSMLMIAGFHAFRFLIMTALWYHCMHEFESVI